MQENNLITVGKELSVELSHEDNFREREDEKDERARERKKEREGGEALHMKTLLLKQHKIRERFFSYCCMHIN